MFRTLTLTAAVLAVAIAAVAAMGSPAQAAASKPACGAEDSPSWTWTRCGNHKRSVVLYTGKHARVTCAGLRAGLERSVISEFRTPWLRGDYSCGRRR